MRLKKKNSERTKKKEIMIKLLQPLCLLKVGFWMNAIVVLYSSQQSDVEQTQQDSGLTTWHQQTEKHPHQRGTKAAYTRFSSGQSCFQCNADVGLPLCTATVLFHNMYMWPISYSIGATLPQQSSIKHWALFYSGNPTQACLFPCAAHPLWFMKWYEFIHYSYWRLNYYHSPIRLGTDTINIMKSHFALGIATAVKSGHNWLVSTSSQRTGDKH